MQYLEYDSLDVTFRSLGHGTLQRQDTSTILVITLTQQKENLKLAVGLDHA